MTTTSDPYDDILGPRTITEKAHPAQIKNRSGGYVFDVGHWAMLDRFLIAGTKGGSYYVGEREQALENFDALQACLAEDPTRVVEVARRISIERRAHRNIQAVFVLAVAACHDDDATRQAVKRAFRDVCRIGTDVFNFVNYVQAIRGGKAGRNWGRSLRTAVGSYYTETELDKLALHLVKYRQRSMSGRSMTHRDVLRLAHPSPGNDLDRNELLAWAAAKDRTRIGDVHPIIDAFEKVQISDSLDFVISAVTEYGLPWEAVPDQWRKEPRLWEALLPSMGGIALIRNIPTFSRLGMLTPLSSFEKLVCDSIREAKGVHPMHALNAMRMNQLGGGSTPFRSWTEMRNSYRPAGETYAPNTSVQDALESLFYSGFGEHESTGKGHLIGVDTSGSMTFQAAGSTVVSCAEAAAAMSLVISHREERVHTVGFSGGVHPLQVSRNARLPQLLSGWEERNGPTDCSAPIEYALSNGIEADVFVLITDNETNRGKHPHESLNRYRRAMGIPAKLVVIGMTSNKFSVAGDDEGSLDVVGFDTATPSLVASFVGAD
jgi:60 kDa SS-A/Ro ribonucleoprotein